MNLEDVNNIVSKTRCEFEENQINTNLLAVLYKRYNSSVGDVDLFIKQSKELFPNLNCGLTTIYLKKILDGGEIVQGKYKNHKHTFLLLDKNTVVDITADQYGGPKTYVGSLEKPWEV